MKLSDPSSIDDKICDYCLGDSSCPYRKLEASWRGLLVTINPTFVRRRRLIASTACGKIKATFIPPACDSFALVAKMGKNPRYYVL